MYAAVLNGASYAPGDIREESHVMIFGTITEARESMRQASRGNPRATLLDGSRTLDTPAFGSEGDSYTLYQLPDAHSARVFEGADTHDLWGILIADNDPYPDYILEFGPRSGIRSYRP